MRPERRSRKRALEDGDREVETEVGDLGKLSTWIEPRHGDPWSLADEDNCLDCCVPCLARLIDALETLSIGQMLLLLACLCAAFMALAAGIVSYSYAHLTPANEPLWPVSFEAVVEATGGLFVNGNCWVPRGATSCAPQFLLSGSSPSHVALLQGLLNDQGDVVPSMGGSAVTVMTGDGQARGESVPRAGLFADDLFDAYLEDYGQEALTLHYMSMFEEITPPCPILRTPYPLHLGKVTGEAHASYLVRRSLPTSAFLYVYVSVFIYVSIAISLCGSLFLSPLALSRSLALPLSRSLSLSLALSVSLPACLYVCMYVCMSMSLLLIELSELNLFLLLLSHPPLSPAVFQAGKP